MLEKLGLFQFKENMSADSLYDHMLETIKLRQYGQSILTNGLVTELHQLLYLARGRHPNVPKDKLSRLQFIHIISFLVAKPDIEDVSEKKFATGLFKILPKDATSQIWMDGINFVLKQAAGNEKFGASKFSGGGDGSLGVEAGDSGGRVADVELGEGDAAVVVHAQADEGDCYEQVGGAGEIASSQTGDPRDKGAPMGDSRDTGDRGTQEHQFVGNGDTRNPRDTGAPIYLAGGGHGWCLMISVRTFEAL